MLSDSSVSIVIDKCLHCVYRPEQKKLKGRHNELVKKVNACMSRKTK